MLRGGAGADAGGQGGRRAATRGTSPRGAARRRGWPGGDVRPPGRRARPATMGEGAQGERRVPATLRLGPEPTPVRVNSPSPPAKACPPPPRGRQAVPRGPACRRRMGEEPAERRAPGEAGLAAARPRRTRAQALSPVGAPGIEELQGANLEALRRLRRPERAARANALEDEDAGALPRKVGQVRGMDQRRVSLLSARGSRGGGRAPGRPVGGKKEPAGVARGPSSLRLGQRGARGRRDPAGRSRAPSPAAVDAYADLRHRIPPPPAVVTHRWMVRRAGPRRQGHSRCPEGSAARARQASARVVRTNRTSPPGRSCAARQASTRTTCSGLG